VRSSRHPGLVAALLAAALLFPALGRAPLLEPDEGRYADVSRAMLLTGDWLAPRMNFIPNFGKPPLFFWLTAAAMRALGPTELAARLVSALSAVGLAALAVALGRRALGLEGWAALLPGVVLVTSPLVFVLGRLCLADTLFALLVAAAFTAFLGALGAEAPRRGLVAAGWGALGLAVLAKGPAALAFPVLVFGAYLLPRARRPRARRLFTPEGLALFLAVALPWHVAMARAHSGWASIYLLQGHIRRVAADPFGRAEPFWFYAPVVAAGFFPWVLFVPAGLRRAIAERGGGPGGSGRWFLALFAVLPVLALSLSVTKLPHYILPVAPALALLATDGALGALPPEGPAARSWPRLLVALSVAAALGFLAVSAVDLGLLLPTPKLAEGVRLFERPLQVALALLCLGLGVSAELAKSRRPRWALGSLAATTGAVLLLAALSLDRMDEWRGSKAVAGIVGRDLPPDARVVMLQRYHRGLPFYLGAPVVLFDSRVEMREVPPDLRDPELLLERDLSRLEAWLGGEHEVRLVVRGSSGLRLLERMGADRPPLYRLGEVGDRLVLTNRATAPGEMPFDPGRPRRR